MNSHALSGTNMNEQQLNWDRFRFHSSDDRRRRIIDREEHSGNLPVDRSYRSWFNGEERSEYRGKKTPEVKSGTMEKLVQTDER